MFWPGAETEMAKQRIGLLGGTFDPIHMGHLLLATHSYDELGLDRVMFIPARLPPHKGKPTVGAEDRLAMVRLAVGDDERFLVCDCELARAEPSYTIDTVRELKGSQGSDSELFWLIGSDMVADLPDWHKVGELVELIEIVVVGRAGQAEPDYSALEPAVSVEQIEQLKARAINLPLIEISSTDIRKRLRGKKSVRYLVRRSVEEYIASHQLYR